MHCVTVIFEIDPGCFGAFVQRVGRQADDSLGLEPGCRRFDVWTGGGVPNQVFLYEVYDDGASFDAHLASDHFRSFDAEVAPWVISKTLAVWEKGKSDG